MKRVTNIVTALSLAALIYLTGCSSDSPTESKGAEQASFSNLRSEALIDLPEAIAKTEKTNSRAKMESEKGEATEIYEGVREFVGFADQIVNGEEGGIKAQLENWRDNLDWDHIEEVGTLTHIPEEKDIKIVASFDSTRELAYKLLLHSLAEENEPIAFQIDFNGDFSSPAGTIYYDLALLERNSDEKIKILVHFAQSDTNKTLDLKITNNAVSEQPDEIGTLQLSLKESNDIIHMSGCASFPNMTDIKAGVIGHSYIFTGTSDFAKNQAIIKLGLPHSTYDKNDETLFTTYGIAEVFMNHFIETEVASQNDTIKSYIVTSYKENLTIEEIIEKVTLGDSDLLHNGSEISAMTTEDFITFLKINKDISDEQTRKEFAHLLWIAELTQPVYFDGNGYAGNRETAPEAFTELASVKAALAPFVPNNVTNLTITIE